MQINRVEAIPPINKKKGNSSRFKLPIEKKTYPKTQTLKRVTKIYKGVNVDYKA